MIYINKSSLLVNNYNINHLATDIGYGVPEADSRIIHQS